MAQVATDRFTHGDLYRTSQRQPLNEGRGPKHSYLDPERIKKWTSPSRLGSAKLAEEHNADYFERLVQDVDGSTEDGGDDFQPKEANCSSDQIRSVARDVELDIGRTFPGNVLFQKINGPVRIRRILTAYASRNPAVGYCQGMNYLVGFLLMLNEGTLIAQRNPNMEPNGSEEPLSPAGNSNPRSPNATDERDHDIDKRVFWMLAAIVEDPKFNYGYYFRDHEMFSLKLDVKTLKHLCRQHLPSTYAHLREVKQEMKLPIWTVIVSSWFITVFVDTLPLEALLRVWDAYTLEGRCVLFRVALSILHLSGEELIRHKDLQVLNYIRQYAQKCPDSQILLRVALRRQPFLSITRKTISDHQEELKKQGRIKAPKDLISPSETSQLEESVSSFSGEEPHDTPNRGVLAFLVGPAGMCLSRRDYTQPPELAGSGEHPPPPAQASPGEECSIM